MKFLIVGLGSMGKRRIRNLQHLKAGGIIGYDIRKDRMREAEQKYGIKTFSTFKEAITDNPDVFIISTPPDVHMEYAMIAAKNNKHFFTEASVVDEGMPKLMVLCKGKKIIAAPSCTMRFHDAVKKMKELVDGGVIGRPLAFTYHSGQYLPNWHPWEDYRECYFSKRETGGARESVSFELVWLTWMFGDIEKISSFKGKLSSIDAEIDDTYQIIIKFKNGVLGHMLIDVITRVPYRVFKLLGDEGVIEWDWIAKRLRVFTARDKKWSEYHPEEGTPENGYVGGEQMYINEMTHFIKALKGEEKYKYSFEEDMKILNMLYAAEKSSEKEVHVEIHGRIKISRNRGHKSI